MKPENISEAVEHLLISARAGVLTRRDVLRRALVLGLTAPVIAQVLAACGGDDDDDDAETPDTSAAAPTTTPVPEEDDDADDEDADPTPDVVEEDEDEEEDTPDPEPTEEEEDDATEAVPSDDDVQREPLLRIIQWQAPTMMNPHLSTGYKDSDAARIACEPLADFDADGNPIPVLAAEFPTLENGGVSEDGMTVTWHLRENVTWHDGEPFTSDDVRFTWEYASNPETGASTAGVFRPIESIDTPDDYTVVVNFTEQNPAGFEIFTGRNGMIIPRHVFEDYVGAESQNAPANLHPIGTGPFKVTEFRPGDVVLYERYENYWNAPKPYFDAVELSGGGDALSATRAVMQTGEADWAWGASGEKAVLEDLIATATEGVLVTATGTGGDRVAINFADPNEEVNGAFAEPTTTHPLFQHKAAREAIALCIPRDVIVDQIYPPGARIETNNLAAPARFASPNTTWEYDLDKARQLLEEAGITPGRLVYQTSVSANRQRVQDVVKANLEQIGFEVELKAIDAATFFSADPGNPDTYTKFYADLETFTFIPDSLYPIGYMRRYRSDDAASQANNWTGPNVVRYQNPEYDALHDQARVEMDPDRQNELFIQMNDISVNDFTEIPIVNGGGGAAASLRLTGYATSPWAASYHDIANWRMEE